MATIIYDAEVFKYNWMFGFKILESNEYVQIWDDFDAIRKFMDEYKSSFFFGFNSSFYDDLILEEVLKKRNPYDKSCRLIDEGERSYSRLKYHRMDLMEGMAVGTSLKSLESELGMAIHETEVDFKLDRPLTWIEKEQTNSYNKHDLDATHRLLELRWNNFVKTKLDLIKYFGLEPKMMGKTFATMIATGLGAQRKSHPPRHFEWFPSLIIDNPEVKEFIQTERFLDENLVFEVCGVEHKMGLGGLHGARDNYKTGKFWKVDVKGYYSLIQMNLNLLSRSLPPEGKAKYRKLYDDRLERKAVKDPSADSLKAGILAVWGATLNQYQLLADISTGNLIMITGQAYMIDLLEKLEPYCTLIQTNTDGIFIEPHDEEMCTEVINEWVARTGFEVETEYGEKIFQKDVNNYVCVVDGEITAKGSYVNLWKMQDDPKFFAFRLTYNQSQGTVIDKAVVMNLIYDIPVEETVYAEKNPKSFQFTVKKGAKSYSHVELHTFNRETEETTIEVKGKVNRVFASKDPVLDRRLYKIKNGNPNIYANLDVNVFIFNNDLSEFGEKEWELLDREYYVQRAKDRIQDFLTPKPVRVKKVKNKSVKIKVYHPEAKTMKNNEDEIKLVTEQAMTYILNQPSGLFRYGDVTINKMGTWYTFTEKTGKTTILSEEKIALTPVLTTKLKSQKIKLDSKNSITILERNTDVLIQYTNKAKPEEDFELEAKTFDEAIELLKENGLLEEETSVEIPSSEPKRRTSSISKEVIDLDENYRVVYESYNLGNGTEWEAILLNKDTVVEKIDRDTVDEIFDKIEEWIVTYIK